MLCSLVKSRGYGLPIPMKCTILLRRYLLRSDVIPFEAALEVGGVELNSCRLVTDAIKNGYVVCFLYHPQFGRGEVAKSRLCQDQ